MPYVLEIIAPVFGLVVLAFGLRKCGVLTRASGDGLSQFMYYVAIPALLFQSLSTIKLPNEIPWRFIAIFYGASFIVFVGGAFSAGRFLNWSRSEQGIAGITSAFSNIVMLGMPLVLAAFGEAGKLPLFILLSLQSLLLFPATTFMVEIYGGVREQHWGHYVRVFARLALNPIILSMVLGLSVNLTGFNIGAAVAGGLKLLACAAPACALVALGVGLAQHRLGGQSLPCATFLTLKNLIHPLLVFAGCLIGNIPLVWTQVAVLLAAMPCGINAFIFASRYELRLEVVAKTVVISTLISALTATFLLHYFLV